MRRRKLKKMAQNNDLSYILWIQSINNQYLFYLSTIIFPFSFVLNFISLAVFLRKRFSNHTNGLFNIYIDIVNNCSFLVGFLYYYTKGIDNDIELWSDLTCKLLNYIFRTIIAYNSWLNVLISFDRMVSVVYPHRFKFMKNRKYICIIFAIIIFLLCLFYIPNLFLNVTTFNETSLALNQTSRTYKIVVFTYCILGPSYRIPTIDV